MVVYGPELNESISNLVISEFQQGIEQTLSKPTLSCQYEEKYDVDESVRACKVEFQFCPKIH